MLGYAEINYLHLRFACIKKNIAGLQIAMQYPFTVGIVHALTDLDEHRQHLRKRAIAKAVQIATLDIFHNQIRKLGFGQIEIENPDNIGMIQLGKGLSLSLKSYQILLFGSSCQYLNCDYAV